MVNSKDLSVAFEWLDASDKLKLFNIHAKKVGKIYYITDDEFNRFLNTHPEYKKMWRKHSRNLHAL